MSRAALAQLDRQIKAVLGPALAAAGFSASPGRTYHRQVAHEGTTSTQIVNVQVGVRSLAGRFTINLAVFNPEYVPDEWPAVSDPPGEADCLLTLRQRLGFLLPPPIWLRWFGRRSVDRWWRQSASEPAMRRTCEEVRAAVVGPGVSWLDGHTARAALQGALEAVEAARARRQRQ